MNYGNECLNAQLLVVEDGLLDTRPAESSGELGDHLAELLAAEADRLALVLELDDARLDLLGPQVAETDEADLRRILERQLLEKAAVVEVE